MFNINYGCINVTLFFKLFFINLQQNLSSRFKYWVDGPIGFTIAIIGLAVNFVAIVILAKQRVQRTFHLLMIFLSCWDFSYLILSILCFALPLLSTYYRDNMSVYLIPYVIPLAQLCLSGSCYSTIALTVERYDDEIYIHKSEVKLVVKYI